MGRYNEHFSMTFFLYLLFETFSSMQSRYSQAKQCIRWLTQVLVLVACWSIVGSSFSDVPASEQHIRKQIAVSCGVSGLNKLQSGPQMSYLFSQSQTACAALIRRQSDVHLRILHSRNISNKAPPSLTGSCFPLLESAS